MVVRRRPRGRGTNRAFALACLAVLALSLVAVDIRSGATVRQAVDDWGLAIAVALVASGAALARRERRRHAADVEGERLDRRVRLVAELDAAMDRERARIAGDLHDTVAHAVSVVVLQSLAGRSALATDPAAAGRMLDGVALSGQHALDELRRLLGSIESPQATSTSDHDGPLTDRLPQLVRRATAAGLPTVLHNDPPAGLPAEVQEAAYRVVQESLTNALRYATGARTSVQLGGTHDRLVVTVENGPAGSDTILNGCGRGLSVMVTRVAAHGGSMTAGPTPDGGWRVRVVFPVLADDAGYDDRRSDHARSQRPRELT